MLISFITLFIAYTETIHSLDSYILIEHVVEHKSKWAVAVRKQVFIELKKNNLNTWQFISRV